MTLDGYVELLQVARPQMSEQEQSQAIAQASRTGKLLVGVLEGILDVRRIDESAVLDPQPVNVAEVVMVAQELLDPREVGLVMRDLHLNVPRDLTIWGEPVRLQQILTNLLSNAIKYSPAGSPLMVQAQRLALAPSPLFGGRTRQTHERGMVEIRVRDFGLGVPKEQIPLLFHRFVRLPRDLGSQVPGNGLGLYLCRVFAEAMGGSIQLESAGIPGEGSTFILRLPAADSAPGVQ
jgi:signal transduction histidine kinase